MCPPIPSGQYRFIAVDVETACSDVGSICQIGLACVTHADTIDCWSTLIDPDIEFSFYNTKVHGISARHVIGAPSFAQVIDQIEPLLLGTSLVQHSGFDRRALEKAYCTNGRQLPSWVWADSVEIARTAWPEFLGNGGHGLANLKRQLSLDFQHHDAGEDARAAALIVMQAEKLIPLDLSDYLR